MGILSGSDNSGQKNQRKENRRAQQYVESQLGYAIDDVNRGYDFADAYRTDAYNRAMGLIGDGTYTEMDYNRRGNIGAQNALINAMPQYQNALLGMPVDYSQFMATDLGMPSRESLNAQMPQPNSYAGYGGVDYQGQPYSQESQSYGPWQAMAYGIPTTPPYVEPQSRGWGEKMQDFGAALGGRPSMGGGNKMQDFGAALSGDSGQMAAIMRMLGR